jgi:hypothetical protein
VAGERAVGRRHAHITGSTVGIGSETNVIPQAGARERFPGSCSGALRPLSASLEQMQYDGRSDHTTLLDLDVGEDVAHKVNGAALPGRTQYLPSLILAATSVGPNNSVGLRRIESATPLADGAKIGYNSSA